MTSTPNRRGPYAKTAAKREAIIRTALEYFAQYGYHGASMREIARQTGLSQAGVLHHFKTKDELLIATIESRDTLTRGAVDEAVGTDGDPLDAIVAIVRDNVSQRRLVRMFVVVSAEATDPGHPANAYFVERAERVIARLGARLAVAVEVGVARPDLDIETTARQCQALMYGLQVQWLLDPSTDMVGIFAAFVDSLRS